MRAIETRGSDVELPGTVPLTIRENGAIRPDEAPPAPAGMPIVVEHKGRGCRGRPCWPRLIRSAA